ncbi:MAG: hypothetical protein IT475_11695 [Aquimonas sp.]|nr:hypothetical protein [Aquimonas sp.]
MQESTIQQLLLALSTERLSSYLRQAPQAALDAQHVGRYAWNMLLSESLYPSLQMLEIVLRNTVHNSAKNEFGRDDWFDVPGLLRTNETDAIRNAKNVLNRKNRATEPSRIVAELSFGFWTSLLDRRYEQTLWPKMLTSAFPYIPRKLRTRKDISARINALRALRNRVFHHEPIWHWQDLTQKHHELIEAIAWISPAARDLVSTVDRFSDVAKQGYQASERAILSRFGATGTI